MVVNWITGDAAPSSDGAVDVSDNDAEANAEAMDALLDIDLAIVCDVAMMPPS